jgi:putative phosphoesterase
LGEGDILVRVLITSDSHGAAKRLAQVVKRVSADHVIHCGDFCTSTEELPNVSLTVVKGNCDIAQVANEEEKTIAGYRFFVVHGHRHQVKHDLLPLSLVAQEKRADIVCFGHSHFPVCVQEGNRLFVNPGSLLRPRGFTVPTYVVMDLTADRSVQVRYFQPDGTPVPVLGGKYML